MPFGVAGVSGTAGGETAVGEAGRAATGAVLRAAGASVALLIDCSWKKT